MGESLLISDLHLSGAVPETLARFREFLEQRAPGTDALYILGDLFDTWIGDDDDNPPGPAVRGWLRALVDSGTPVHIQHGNRDFLIGEQFCEQSGASLLEEEAVVTLSGRQALLMHGDTLCTDDTAYQQARQMLRNPAFIRDFLSRTLAERAAIADGYRRQSGEATSLLAAEIMDVNAGAVAAAMARHGVDCLIHGHTHRPGRHSLQDGRGERIVLGEWHPDRAVYASASPGGLVLAEW
jgi:UDP-2,3-diacylglucosamine hydrolase